MKIPQVVFQNNITLILSSYLFCEPLGWSGQFFCELWIKLVVSISVLISCILLLPSNVVRRVLCSIWYKLNCRVAGQQRWGELGLGDSAMGLSCCSLTPAEQAQPASEGQWMQKQVWKVACDLSSFWN